MTLLDKSHPISREELLKLAKSQSIKKYHTTLTKQKWAALPLCEKMANIGSEVHRAIRWKKQNNTEYSNMAFFRSLELLDLSLETTKGSTLREIARTREALVDFFAGDNIYKTTTSIWEKYFNFFLFQCRKNY